MRLFRTPEGFLDLTGNRVGGRYPPDVSDVAVATIDMTPLLTGRLLASETGASLVSNAGTTIDITVPDNENWILFSVSTTVIRVATTNKARTSVELTNLPQSDDPANIVKLCSLDGVTTMGNGLAATSPITLAHTLPQPIALSPGVILRATIDETNENGMGWAFQAGFFRLTGN